MGEIKGAMHAVPISNEGRLCALISIRDKEAVKTLLSENEGNFGQDMDNTVYDFNV